MKDNTLCMPLFVLLISFLSSLIASATNSSKQMVDIKSHIKRNLKNMHTSSLFSPLVNISYSSVFLSIHFLYPPTHTHCIYLSFFLSISSFLPSITTYFYLSFVLPSFSPSVVHSFFLCYHLPFIHPLSIYAKQLRTDWTSLKLGATSNP
jgi:hypothetical protein